MENHENVQTPESIPELRTWRIYLASAYNARSLGYELWFQNKQCMEDTGTKLLKLCNKQQKLVNEYIQYFPIVSMMKQEKIGDISARNGCQEP